MSDFWRFAKQMLEYRGTFIAAMVFAFLSAAGLGVGLLSLAPMMRVILSDGGRTLQDLAIEHNAADPMINIPQTLVGWLPDDPFAGVQLVLGALVLLTIFGAFCNFLHLFLSQKLATVTIAQIRQAAFDRVLLMPLGRVVARGPSQLVARIIRDTVELQRGFLSLTSKMIAQITKGLAAFGAALYFNWALTLTALVVAPVMAVIIRKLGKHIRRGTSGALEAQEHLLRLCSENLQGLRAVKANTAEQQASRRFARVNAEVVRQSMRVLRARSISSPTIETLAIVVVCVLVMISAKLILDNQLSFEEFVLTIGALAVAGGSFRPLTGLVNEIQAASAPAKRIADLLDEAIEPDHPGRAIELPRHHHSIDFEHVTFTYLGADEPALVDVTLRINHGERVAIVGPNGSGKTSLVSLLPRLLTPQKGRVLIDNVDIESVRLRSLRGQIGVVTQETVLFRGSIADNIAFGLDEATRDQIIRAAKDAHAHEFIERIPGGYDADLAEQGASLSGGQRQRLAIARAILRDPSILILDEATSQIDAESEYMIGETLLEFCRGRTSLIIAHRLSTVLNADRIIVMAGGSIVAIGTHAELRETSELYERLIRTQLILSD